MCWCAAVMQEMDLAQKSKADGWQSFLKGKATKKKTGGWPVSSRGGGLVGMGPYVWRVCRAWG